MADRNLKDSTPPPLLLMPASGGLTLNPVSGSSLLMPVPQMEASLMTAEEEGEVDSFLGQSPQLSQSNFNYFNNSKPQGSMLNSDPFAQVRQPSPARQTPPPPPAANQPMYTPTSLPHQAPGMPAQNVAMPPSMATPPPPRAGGNPNMYRMAGPPRYAVHSGMSELSYVPQTTAPHTQPGPIAPPPMNSSLSLGMAPGDQTATPSMQSDLHPPMSVPSGFSPMPFTPPPQSSQTSSSSSSRTTSPSSNAPILPTHFGAFAAGYIPVKHHWFYCRSVELRQYWRPFSLVDSMKLEDTFRAGAEAENIIVSVEGGRYDVNVIERTRTAVYWDESQTKVCRCSWFYKPEGESRFIPYEEDFAEKLEIEYKNAVSNNVWHKRLEFPGGETIVMHKPDVIVHFSAAAQPDEWGTTQGEQLRPRVVKRGIEDFEGIEDGEPAKIDHVVFVVHGIGSTCDLRFRNIVECVDDFRAISLQMLSSHFGQHQAEGRVGRVEFLPVRWHGALHSDATGVDRRLKAITLGSIGKLRHFTNDTLLDILFYASPTYCQNIADTVGAEINRLHQLFLQRNNGFDGQFSVAGHSLGSLIMFDLLAHQKDPSTPETTGPVASHGDTTTAYQNGTALIQTASSRELTPILDETSSVQDEGEVEDLELTVDQLLEKLGLQDHTEAFHKEQIDMETLIMCEDSDIKELGVPMGPRKKLQGFLRKHKQRQQQRAADEERKAAEEEEKRKHTEAQNQLKKAQEQIQTRLLHDPVMRSVSSTSVNYVTGGVGTGLPLVRYPQINFCPTAFFALGSPISMFITVRGVEMLGEDFKLPTCPSFFNIFHPFDPVAYRIEPLISSNYPLKPVLMPHHKGRKRLHLELRESLARMGTDIKQKIIDSFKATWQTINDFALAHRTSPGEAQEQMEQELNTALSQMSNVDDDNADTASIASSMHEDDVMIGSINQSRRIDYVLQEKPIESFNDYLFALGSHACYWESEDTVLMILKEIYDTMGIAPVKRGLPATPQHGVRLPSPRGPGLPTPYGNATAPPMFNSPPIGSFPPPGGYAASPIPGPPPASTAATTGPPPLSGFVRK